MPAQTIVADATCTACGCACDDIELASDGQRIVAAARACPKGEQWFFAPRDVTTPSCRIAGQAADLNEGIERAAEILAGARYPLVYGMSETTCEAQRLAVSIADWIGACVDTPTSSKQGPVGLAFQGVGEVTSSLGEVANRGDLVMFWGTDPAVSHPRHFSRYSLEPRGMFVPGGRADRTCIVIDVTRTASAGEADLFLQLKAGSDFEALWTLRALLAEVTLDAKQVEADTGIALTAWQDLAELMKSARFGVLFYGQGLSSSRGRYFNSEALLALVRDLNAFTRFVAKPMRGRGNVVGADNVVTWRTGFPFGVNLARGYPRFGYGEYTAADLLARGEPDAALLVTSDLTSEASDAARAHLARIPYVSIDFRDTETARRAAVSFTTAAYGIHTPGTVYRMDDVPLPLRPALSSPHPSDVEILGRLESRVRELTAPQV